MRTVTLGEICEIVSGGTPKTDVAEYWDGDIAWATPKDLSGLDTPILSNTQRRITQAGLRASSAVVLPAGAVLLSSRAPIGLVALAGCPVATNQGCKSLVPGPDVHGPFLYHALRYNRAKLDAAGNGATFREVSKAAVERFEIGLPNLDAQRRFADQLDLADGIRRKRREALHLADELVRATFLEMFGDPVGNPRGWPIAHLGDLATDLRYGTSAKCTETKGESDLPVLRIPNVIGGKVGYTDLKYASLPGNEVRLTTLEPGDLLFVRSNGNPEHIGRCAVFDGADEPYLFASYLIRARLRTQLVADSHFLQYQLSSPRYREALARMARTTAGNYNVSAEALSKLKIIVPPMELQQKFLASVGAADRYMASASKGLEEAETLFASLQNQAFGEPQ